MFFSGSRDIVGLKWRLGTFEVTVLRSLTNNHDLKEGTSVADSHLGASQNETMIATTSYYRQQASSRTSLFSSLSLLTIEDLPVDAELPPHLLHQDMIMLAAKEDDKLSKFMSL